MHDTALSIGGLVMRTYCPQKGARILDVGSQDMNGSLRDVAPKDAKYTGLDYEDGKGVDIVLEPGKPWPVDDDHFDLVLATSVLEHDPAFWVTFEAMCRKAKPGGHIYISAPSNGIVHRCPQDYWRFYPDSGLALKEWVARQDLDVTLIESFMAEREADMWNDFCAIFRREPSPEPLNRNYVYLKVPSTNAIVWESNEVLNPRTESEDMMLIVRGREEVQKLQDHIGWREHQIAGEKTAWAAERDELVRNAAEASVAREALAIQQAAEREAASTLEHELRGQLQGLEGQLHLLKAELTEREQRVGQLESNLAQRRAEIDEALADAARARELHQAAEDTIAEQRQRIQQLGREVCDAQDLVLRLSQERDEAVEEARSSSEQTERLERINRNTSRELGRLQVAMGQLHQAERATRAELSERTDELAEVTRSLVEQEDKLRWLRDVHASLSRRPWWWAIMPRPWQKRREERRLARAGLFDARQYLEERPDVRESRLDPLKHYIFHGMDEEMPNIRFWSS